MNNPVKQHTVPKFYLKQFSDDPKAKKPRISVIDIESEESTTARTEKTSVIHNFYTMNVDGNPDFSLENGMGRIESQTARVFQRLTTNTWPLSGEDRLMLAMFISLTMLRGRGSRDLINQPLSRFANSSFDEVRRFYSEKYGQSIDQHGYNVVTDLITRSKTDPSAAAELHAIAMRQTIPFVTGHLLQRPWALLNYKNTSLVTGDQPVGFAIHRNGLFGPGVSSRVTFPLTRTKAIIMGGLADQIDLKDGRWDSARDGTVEEAEHINNETARFSSWQLYCTPGSEELVRRIDADILEDRWVMRPDILCPRDA